MLVEPRERRYERSLALCFVLVEEGEGSDGGGDTEQTFEIVASRGLVMDEIPSEFEQLDATEEEVKSGDFLNDSKDQIPFELHFPNYEFCGAGTELAERFAAGKLVSIRSTDAVTNTTSLAC